MAWGFFDWIRNKGWLSAGREKRFTLSPPASDEQIRQAIELLLDDRRAWEARPALHDVRDHAAPLIEQAVRDPRFRESTHWPVHCAATALEMMLELLDDCGSATPLREAEGLADAPQWEHRRMAARYLARSGRARYAPQVMKLLADPEHMVAKVAVEQLNAAAVEGRVEPELAAPVYDLMHGWAFRTGKGLGSGAAKLMLRLDRKRAVADLTAPAAFDLRLNWLHYNLRALREAGVAVPTATLRRLLDDALRRYDDEPDTRERQHWSSIAEECLTSLAHARDEQVDAMLQQMLRHPFESLRNHAADLREKRSAFGADGAVLRAFEVRGFARLNEAQRSYLCVFIIDAEVRNGGFLQYFSNSYGEHVGLARAALTEMGASAAAQIVADAIKLFGPGGVPTDRGRRNDALARLIPRDSSPFDGHDDRWYADEDHLRVRLHEFAVRHRAELES